MGRPRRGIFSNLTFCLSPNLQNSYEQNSQNIRNNGGKLWRSVKRGTTHLITTEQEVKESDELVLKAIELRARIVSEKWLEDCVSQGVCLDERKYQLTETESQDAMEEDEYDAEKLLDPEITFENFKAKKKKVDEMLKKNFEKYLNDKDSADVVFQIKEDSLSMKQEMDTEDGGSKMSNRSLGDDERNLLYGHRAVIASKSPVLKALIEQSTEQFKGITLVRIRDTPFELFEALLETIYTGEVEESHDSLESNFAFREVCLKYGLEEVAFWLETGFWKPKNICMLLEMASSSPPKTHIQQLRLDTLKSFFNQHASSAIKSDSFKLISKATLISILDSDQLEINEMDLFQNTLQWIEYQVSTVPEKEQSNYRQQLHHEILPKIRFPLMSTQDLILHVEPLKIVPKDFILEAYRHIAVDLAPWEWPSHRCRPRGLSKPRWIKESWFHQINQWIRAVTKQRISVGKLLFSTERDPFSNQKFHEKCDDKGPTITVVKSGDYIFGGFTMHPWGSASGYAADNHAFIFTLSNGAKRKPYRFLTVQNKKLAIYDVSDSGPTWGGGHDLHINLSGNSYSSLGHTYQIPKGHTYGDHSSAIYLAGKKEFHVDHVVVFQGRKTDLKK
jgi:hypothetical protein